MKSSSQEIDPDYQRLLVEVWLRNETTILGWVASLQTAAASLLDGGLNREAAEQAGRDAHRLRGCLGNFGLRDASKLAEQIESILVSPQWSDPANRRILTGLIQSLEQNILQNRLG